MPASFPSRSLIAACADVAEVQPRKSEIDAIRRRYPRDNRSVRNRIGVIRYGSAADGSRQLILPSGEIAEVSGDLTDAGIAERFGHDVVRHADAPRWCQGVCRDGPMTGEFVYAVDRVGSRVVIALPPRPGGVIVEYEVTQVSSDANLAELRLCQD